MPQLSGEVRADEYRAVFHTRLDKMLSYPQAVDSLVVDRFPKYLLLRQVHVLCVQL
jgi:hypothetical protein